MPCADSLVWARDEEQARFDKLTRMLCWCCLRMGPATIEQNRELAAWWKKHQKEDEKRKKHKPN